MENQNKPQLDLSKTISLETWSGGKVWISGYVLRTLPKFANGNSEEELIPVPIFFDPQTGRILDNALPPEIRNEYAETPLPNNDPWSPSNTENLDTTPSSDPWSSTTPNNDTWNPSDQQQTQSSFQQNPLHDQPKNNKDDFKSSKPIWGQM